MIDERKPFDPAKLPFFYGYVIVICTTLGLTFSGPGQTVGVSVFTDYLIENLAIKRVVISTAYMVGTILSSFLVARAGKLIDRWGIRFISALSAMGLGAILFYMSQVDRITNSASLLLTFIGHMPVAFIFVTFGFTLMRFFGQGMLTLASRTMLMEWFVVRRGRMNGIASLFISILFAGAPLGFEKLIRDHGWRGAWIILGLAVGAFFTLFVLLFYRNKPESCGLLPDGVSKDDLAKGPEEADKKQKQHEGLLLQGATVKEALRTYDFWIYNLALSMFALINTALMFHIISIFAIHNLTRDNAISIFPPSIVVAVIVNLLVGYLSDISKLKYFLMLMIVSLILNGSGVFFIDSGVGWWMFVVGSGIGSGIYGTLSAVTWPRLFGREHLGEIAGFNMSFLVFFSAIGPFIFGLSFDLTGHYLAGAFVCICVCLLLLVAAFRPSLQ